MPTSCFAAGESERRGAVRHPELELARRRDERSGLTASSPEVTHLDQVILELERKVFEATQHDKAQAAAELADKEKQLTDRGIAVLQAPTAGVQK